MDIETSKINPEWIFMEGKWYHIVVADGCLYINGVKVQELEIKDCNCVEIWLE